MIAKFISDMSAEWRGTAQVFEVDPPIDNRSTVVVSSVPCAFDTGEAECFIFPWDIETQDVASWLELSGSRRGVYTPRELLEGIGYTVE